MKPIKTKVCNTVYNKPAFWDETVDGECNALPACRTDQGIYSYWKLTFWERVKVFFGRPVRLVILSQNMPPVALDIAEKAEL